MDFRKIETANKYPDVLLQRDISESGENIVIIKAYGMVDDVNDYIMEETITFDNVDSTRSFIEDFSDLSANKWCEKRNIKFQ